MKANVRSFVAECATCQEAKYLTLALVGLLQACLFRIRCGRIIAMDFIEGLPKSDGYDSIMVVINRLSNYAHFFLLKHPLSAHSVADVFVKEVVRLHGYPRSIVLDRDKIFTRLFWGDLIKKKHDSHLEDKFAKSPATYDCDSQ